MSIQKAVADFLLNSYRPVSLTIPIDEFKNIKYENPLFKCSTIIHKENEGTRNILCFSTVSPLITTSIQLGSLIWNKCFQSFTSEVEISDTKEIVPKDQGKVRVLYNYSLFVTNEVKEITITNNGEIPTRFMIMLYDFYLKNSIIKYLPIEQKTIDEVTQLVETYNDKQLKKLIMLVHTIPNKYIEVKNNDWFTHDEAQFSPSAEKFMDACLKYHSFYFDEKDMGKKPVLKYLFATQGGFNFSYLWYSPFTEVNNYIRFGSLRLEAKGSNSYGTNSDFNFEELVILYEAMKKEGLNVELK